MLLFHAGMKVEAAGKRLADVEDKCVIIAFFEDSLKVSSEVKGFDNGIIESCIKNKDFKAEENEVKVIYVNKANVKYAALLGLGKEKKFNSDKLMNVMGNMSKKIRDMGIDSFSVYLESFRSSKFDACSYSGKITQAIVLSLYQFLKYKTKDLDKVKKFTRASIIVERKDHAKAEGAVREALIYAEAVNKTRDLVNTPPNVATPEYVAKYAHDVAKANGLKYTALDEKQLEKLGMECFLAVGKASVNKPKMIILEYNNGGSKKPLVLVGKGITFDTGGINVKPPNYMISMKDDKAGACSVIHVLEACAKLKLKVNVVGIGALAENMISGNAYKPDDVLKSYSGITVEVLNSDAEGRMVLADSLAYSLKYKPQAVVDIATLTGASIIALGYFGSPVMGNNQKVVDKLIDAGKSSLDRLWQLPIWDEHETIIKSDIADVKHLSSDIDAGVIVGGVFLKQFVKDVPWAHIDIGGTVVAKQDNGYKVKGATGFGVRLLIDFVRNWK
jgi:leucyl aminopeptidase